MKSAKLNTSMPEHNPFGDLVAKARIAINLSQRALAQKIGKSATYINYVERGYNPASKDGKFQVSREAVEKIAKVLSLDLNEALNAAGYAADNAIVISSLNGEFDPEDIEKIKEYIELIRLKKRSLIN